MKARTYRKDCLPRNQKSLDVAEIVKNCKNSVESHKMETQNNHCDYDGHSSDGIPCAINIMSSLSKSHTDTIAKDRDVFSKKKLYCLLTAF